MPKKTIRDLNVAGKRLLIRVDFNVPTADDGSISDDTRIRAALPTLLHALDQGASVVLMTHFGRPKGPEDKKYNLDRVAKRLQEVLPKNKVQKCDEVVGPQAKKMAESLKSGEVLLLENVRMHPGEKDGDEAFAKQLRELGDAYVNDAFGTCHRKDASMYAVPKQFPKGSRVIGFLVEKELRILSDLLGSPKQPMIALMGGAKVSDKIGVIEALLQRVEKLLIGGAMAYTFMKSQGKAVGNSLVENDKLDLAKRLLEKAKGKIVLPEDHVVAKKPEATAESKVVDGEIPDGWLGLDIGPKTTKRYADEIAKAGTVLWNGPMGKFEDEPFRNGTDGVLRAMAASKAVTVVGGGESGEAAEQSGLAEKMSHVSTGGGAFLEYIENGTLPALEVIDDA